MLIDIPNLKTETALKTEHVNRFSSISIDQHFDVNFVANLLTSPSGLGRIRHDTMMMYYSDGAFSFIQLLTYVLAQTGKADAILTTYSIAEDMLKVLKRQQDRGEIGTIRFLIDNRVRTISPKPFGCLVTAFPDAYRLRAVHAKVCLVYNDDWKVTIVGSQNATHNPKLETGVLFTSEDVFNFHKSRLEHEFDCGTT